MNNQFSDNLKKIRKENNLSQEQLAELLGVSRQAVSKWESSAAYPEMDKILALCEKFDMNIDDLLHKDIREVKGEEESKKKLNQYIEDFLKFVTDTINMFCAMSFKSKCKFLTEQIIIGTVLLMVCIFLGTMGRNIVFEIIFTLPDKMRNLIYSVIEGIYILFSFMCVVIIMLHVFKTRYLDYYMGTRENVTLPQLEESDNTIESTQEKADKDKVSDVKTRKLFGKKEERVIIRDPKHSEYRFINALLKCIIVTVKLCVLGLSSFLFVSLVCLFIAFMLNFLLLSTGILFVGISSAILSAAVINVIFILIALNFVFNRKNDKKKMIWAFIISLMVLGSGCGMALVGTLNLEYITAGKDMMKTDYIEFEMTDDLMLHCYYDTIEYIEADNESIRLEYTISKYSNIKWQKNYNSMLTLWAEPDNSIEIIKDIINGLKDKKVISVEYELMDMKVYTTKENIEKLEKNINDYYDNEKQLQDTKISYENKIYKLEEEINEYLAKEWEYQQKIEELESRIIMNHNNMN